MNTDKTILITIIATLVTILLAVVGIILQQYIQVAQFLAIVIACGIVIIVLSWLPKQTGQYITEYLKSLETRLGENLQIGKENKSEIVKIDNKLNDVCAELFRGDEQRMSWSLFWARANQLLELVQADGSFKPDMVLSVGRSGAIVGSLLAGNMHGLPHVSIDRINRWSTDGHRSSRKVEIFPSPRILAKELEGKNVLCVMSECDSGRTLEALSDELGAIHGIGKVKTAVLCRNVNTYFKPDYIAVEDYGKRPNFPFRTSTWRDDSKSPQGQYYGEKSGPPVRAS